MLWPTIRRGLGDDILSTFHSMHALEIVSSSTCSWLFHVVCAFRLIKLVYTLDVHIFSPPVDVSWHTLPQTLQPRNNVRTAEKTKASPLLGACPPRSLRTSCKDSLSQRQLHVISVRVREATHFPLENGRFFNLLSPHLFEALRRSIKIVHNETKKTKALESGKGKHQNCASREGSIANKPGTCARDKITCFESPCVVFPLPSEAENTSNRRPFLTEQHNLTRPQRDFSWSVGTEPAAHPIRENPIDVGEEQRVGVPSGWCCRCGRKTSGLPPYRDCG